MKYAFQKGRASAEKNNSHQSVFRLCSISVPENEVPSVLLPCKHRTEHCREPGHENSAGFSLKASWVANAKSLSRSYRSLRWSFPWLCFKSSRVVLQGSPLCVMGCTPGQAVLVIPDRAAGPKKRPGVHLLLASILFLERGTWARQEWEGFSPVSFLSLPPNKNRLSYPFPYQTLENIPPKENENSASWEKN